jgi:hypothetical protein
MRKRTNLILALVAAVALIAVFATVRTAAARQSSVVNRQDSLTMGEDRVKQLLVLMDDNESGKVSKQQFMGFMDAEFARLDRNKTGVLDVTALTQSEERPRSFTSVGK